MKVRANGLSLPDLDTLAALETGRYWTPAKRPGEPLYRPAINNGYWAEDIITDGLVLYVPLWLYSGSKFPSVDAYKHTCTVTGATWGLQGRTFDASGDKIAIPNLFAAGSTAITVEAWVKLTQTGTARHIVVDSGWSFGNSWLLYILATQKVGFTTNTTAGSSEALTGASAISQDVFAHILGTFDKNGDQKAHVFVNMVEGTAGAAKNGTFGTANAAWIGRNDVNTWKGIIGEVRVYNRGLSLAEFTLNRNVTRWRYA